MSVGVGVDVVGVGVSVDVGVRMYGCMCVLILKAARLTNLYYDDMNVQVTVSASWIEKRKEKKKEQLMGILSTIIE